MRTGQVWPLAYLPLLASRVFSMVGTGPPPPFLSASQDLKLPLLGAGLPVAIRGFASAVTFPGPY